MKKIISLLFATVMLASLVACGGSGTSYTGSAESYGGELTVEVKMDGETITDVKVTKHTDTEGIGSIAVSEIPGAIVAANSTSVDVVTGATITSRAIISAVNSAIN